MPDNQLPDRPPRTVGAVLTLDPDGKLLVLLAPAFGFDAVSPQVAQQVWSAARDRKRRFWQDAYAVRLEHDLVIEWRSDPITIACEKCSHPLGRYIAYKSGAEYGIVEDRGRRSRSATSPAQSAKSRFRLDGRPTEKAGKTAAVFRCARCKRDIRRNLATLGRRLFTDSPTSVAI